MSKQQPSTEKGDRKLKSHWNLAKLKAAYNNGQGWTIHFKPGQIEEKNLDARTNFVSQSQELPNQ